MRFVLPLVLLIAAPASAQSDVIANDGRFLTLDYSAEGIFHIPTSPDTSQTVLFGQGEVVRSVIVSDPRAYLVNVSGAGDSLSLRASTPTSLAVMNVRTDSRSYDIELVARPGSAPVVVRFSYGIAVTPATRTPEAITLPEGVSWHVSGSRDLRPQTIVDDGEKTYITWNDEQAMPAVFAVGPSGSDEMVNGYVRDGLFTIDRVHPQLVFRIDREQARARRMVKR